MIPRENPSWNVISIFFLPPFILSSIWYWNGNRQKLYMYSYRMTKHVESILHANKNKRNFLNDPLRFPRKQHLFCVICKFIFIYSNFSGSEQNKIKHIFVFVTMALYLYDIIIKIIWSLKCLISSHYSQLFPSSFNVCSLCNTFFSSFYFIVINIRVCLIEECIHNNFNLNEIFATYI